MSLEQCFYISRVSYESNNWINNLLEKEFNISDNLENKIDDILINDIRNYLLKKKNKFNLNIKINFDRGLPNMAVFDLEDDLIISFCGLTSKLDAINCLNCLLTYNNELDCYVHKGFNNILKIIVDEIELILDIKNKKNVVFTGHSLGGAISKILCLYFNKYKSKNYSCITFASPMVGDQSFGDNFNKYVKKTLNLICKDDYVIQFPIFRKCKEDNCYIIENGKLCQYKDKNLKCLINPSKWNLESHVMGYFYQRLIIDKPNLLSIYTKFYCKNE